MAEKTNIVYFILDAENNPTTFAAVDTDSAEWISDDNLDPQTKNVRTVVADNSGTWTSHTGVSADGFTKWNQTTSDMAGVSGNIATNTTSAVALNHYVGYLGSNSGTMATNTASAVALNQYTGYLGTVSSLGGSSAEIQGLYDQIYHWSAITGATEAGRGGAGWYGAWYRVFSTSAGWNSTKSTVDTKESDWDYASETAASGVTHGYGALSGSMQLARGSGQLSAVAVSSAGHGTLDYSVPSFDMGANKIAWRRPGLIRTGTAIVIPGGEDNLTFNLTSNGKSNLIASGITAKSLDTATFSSTNSELYLGMGSVTVSAFALQVATHLSALSVSATDVSADGFFSNKVNSDTVSSTDVTALSLEVGVSAMPTPAPFGYYALTADDAASSDEQILGYSNNVASIISDATQIGWYETPKHFSVSADGWYKVQAVVILEGGSSLVDIAVKKNGSDVLVGSPRVHSTVDPLEHSIQAVVECAAADYITVTYEATAAATVKGIVGSTVLLERVK